MPPEPGDPLPALSWAEVAQAARPRVNSALPVDASVLEKLKQTVLDVFKVDEDI